MGSVTLARRAGTAAATARRAPSSRPRSSHARVGWRDAVERAAEGSQQPGARDRPARLPPAASERVQLDVELKSARRPAERQPQRELLAARRDRIRHHAEHAHRGQSGGRTREDGRRRGGEPGPRHGLGRPLVHHLHVVDWQRRIDLRDRPAKRRDDARRLRGLDQVERGRIGELQVRRVEVGPDRFIDRPVLHVGPDADDFDRSRRILEAGVGREPPAFPDWIVPGRPALSLMTVRGHPRRSSSVSSRPRLAGA